MNYTYTGYAGQFSRKITVLDQNGQSLCETNAVNFTFVTASNADVNCVILGGTLQNATYKFQNCAIPEWTLYQAMAKRNLIKSPIVIGGANPASANCTDVGGHQKQTVSGPDGICLVDKNTLISHANVLR